MAPRLLARWLALSTLLMGCGETPTAWDAQRAALGDAPAVAATARSPMVRELCLPARAALAPSAIACSRSDALDDALGSVGLDRCTFGVNAKAPWVLPPSGSAARHVWLAEALLSPLAFTAAARDLGRSLDAALASATPVALALVAARSVSGAAAGDCFTVVDDTLANVLHDRGLVAAADEAEVATRLSGVPAELGRALAPILVAIADARDAVNAAVPADASSRTSLENTVNWVMWSAPTAPTDADVAIATQVDVDRMTRAAARLALVIESAGLQRFKGLAIPNVVVPTTIGDIVLRGADADVDDGARTHVALWLDTGGNDTIRGTAGAATKAQSVSVLIDLDGADRYGYVEKDAPTKTRLASDASGRLDSGRTASRTPRQGGALFGIGLTFDYGGGDDTYRSLALSQGAGAFGVGVLFDEAGADDAAAETVSQGAAIAGVGLLLDGSGDDARHLFTRGQGYGAFGGVGMLVDAGGDDIYRADPGDTGLGGELLYPSDLLSKDSAPVKGNHNAVQGFGEGRRGLAGTAGIAAGGLGVLRDRTGSDRYEAGLFAQGSALEEGAGVLLDGAGDDRYDGLAYVQGAGLHRGFAALVDEAGDDAYNASFPIVQTSIGVGHDYGVGIVLDLGGKDVIHAPTLSLGAGSANGAGLFVATGGDDAFSAANKVSFGSTLEGGVTGDRKKEVTAGVFVKADGHASYVVAGRPTARVASYWHDDDHEDDGSLRSVGLDAPSGHVTF